MTTRLLLSRCRTHLRVRMFARCCTSSSSQQQPTRVKTQYGTLRGFVAEVPSVDSSDAPVQHADIFLNVPFAEPITHKTRFERPRPYKASWTQERDATEYGVTSPPLVTLSKEPFGDDCLVCSIYRPHGTTADARLPVIVFLAVGLNMLSSARTGGYKHLYRNFGSSGVIIVRPQCRVGLFGFGSLGPNSSLPGNLALWDMTEALKWIAANIEAFGGDPDRVTVMAYSAGAVLAGLLTLSPHSRDYLSGTIEMSSSLPAPWAVKDDSIEYTRQFAETTGCSSNASSSEVLAHFDKMSTAEIVEKTNKYAAKIDRRHMFAPIFDSDFFPQPLAELQRETRVSALIGVTTMEGLFYAHDHPHTAINEMLVTPEQIESYGRTELVDYIHRWTAAYSNEIGINRVSSITERLVNFYTRDADDSKNLYINRYLEFISDAAWNVPACLHAEARAACGARAWFYLQKHYNAAQFKHPPPLLAATHVIENEDLFGQHNYAKYERTDDDRQACQTTAQTFVNFAKHQDPGWAPVSTSTFTYGELSTDLRVIKQPPFNERYAFWKSLDFGHLYQGFQQFLQ